MNIDQLTVIEKRQLLEAAQNIAKRNEYGEVKTLIEVAERIMSHVMQKDLKLVAVDRSPGA